MLQKFCGTRGHFSRTVEPFMQVEQPSSVRLVGNIAPPEMGADCWAEEFGSYRGAPHLFPNFSSPEIAIQVTCHSDPCDDCQLASFVRTIRMLFVLSRFSQTGIRHVVVTTPFTERFAATPSSTVGTDRSSAVSALGYSTIAAGRPYVTIAVSVFDLTVHCSTSAQASSHECQPATGSL